MNSRIPNRQRHLYLIGAFVLVLGLGAAVLIYVNADDDSGSAIGYELVNGVAYPIASADSKRYQYDVKLYGGKFALLAGEFSDWLVSLWHGRTLAFTVAALSVAVSAGTFLAANLSASDPGSDVPGKSNRDGAG